MADGLRTLLIGAWNLVSYQEIPVDGSDPIAPLGHEPRGLLLYTPDGYMSVQLAKPDRPHFPSGDWFAGTAEDYESEATSYIAYTGPFAVDEDGRSVTHFVLVSLFPNWVGRAQVRLVEVGGDILSLSTTSPIQSGGRTVHALVTWRRAEPR